MSKVNDQRGLSEAERRLQKTEGRNRGKTKDRRKRGWRAVDSRRENQRDEGRKNCRRRVGRQEGRKEGERMKGEKEKWGRELKRIKKKRGEKGVRRK